MCQILSVAQNTELPLLEKDHEYGRVVPYPGIYIQFVSVSMFFTSSPYFDIILLFTGFHASSLSVWVSSGYAKITSLWENR